RDHQSGTNDDLLDSGRKKDDPQNIGERSRQDQPSQRNLRRCGLGGKGNREVSDEHECSPCAKHANIRPSTKLVTHLRGGMMRFKSSVFTGGMLLFLLTVPGVTQQQRTAAGSDWSMYRGDY